MEKHFKKLLGNRVYLEIPKEDEKKVIVDENTKEALKREMLKKYSKLKVVAVGEGVGNIGAQTGISSPVLQEGDFVLVEPEALARKAVMVELSDTLTVALVSYFDIIHIW